MVINTDRMVAEFLEMVRIDSVSGKERDMADLVKRKLEELGMEPFEDEAGIKINCSTGNIIARLSGGNGVDGQTILLSAHLDTVEPGRGINPVIKDGIIRSSGDTVLGGDDKAGIAIILETLRVIKENNIHHPNLELVFTVFEEGGLLGAKNINPGVLNSNLGYILDSSGNPGTVITSAPAQDQISVTIKGKSAHSGFCPENGINAIEVAAKAIASIQQGRIDHETTVNIGIISGGNATNIVPDSVFVKGETRSRNRAKKEFQTQLMEQKFQEVAHTSGAKVDIIVEKLYYEFNLEKNQKVVQLTVEAAEKAGVELKLESTGGGSDANIFNEIGIPSVALGIGMENVHTTEEFIRIKDMEDCCRFLIEILKRAARE